MSSIPRNRKTYNNNINNSLKKYNEKNNFINNNI